MNNIARVLLGISFSLLMVKSQVTNTTSTNSTTTNTTSINPAWLYTEMDWEDAIGCGRNCEICDPTTDSC